MTQKEYKEEIEKLSKQLAQTTTVLQKEKDKNFNYEEVLQRYYYTNEELRREKEANELNCRTIQQQQKIIERYEKILDKFTINY